MTYLIAQIVRLALWATLFFSTASLEAMQLPLQYSCHDTNMGYEQLRHPTSPMLPNNSYTNHRHSIELSTDSHYRSNTLNRSLNSKQDGWIEPPLDLIEDMLDGLPIPPKTVLYTAIYTIPPIYNIDENKMRIWVPKSVYSFRSGLNKASRLSISGRKKATEQKLSTKPISILESIMKDRENVSCIQCQSPYKYNYFNRRLRMLGSKMLLKINIYHNILTAIQDPGEKRAFINRCLWPMVWLDIDEKRELFTKELSPYKESMSNHGVKITILQELEHVKVFLWAVLMDELSFIHKRTRSDLKKIVGSDIKDLLLILKSAVKNHVSIIEKKLRNARQKKKSRNFKMLLEDVALCTIFQTIQMLLSITEGLNTLQRDYCACQKLVQIEINRIDHFCEKFFRLTKAYDDIKPTLYDRIRLVKSTLKETKNAPFFTKKTYGKKRIKRLGKNSLPKTKPWHKQNRNRASFRENH